MWSQKLPDWIAAHVRVFAYFGASPAQTVGDNLKAGITKPWGKRGSCSAMNRMVALGFGWADVTVTQIYTIFDIPPLLADEFVRRGAPGGLTRHFAGPPVQGLDFEVRGVGHELVISRYAQRKN